jgi:SH3 domain-containing YSC84-like protein 1
MRARCPILALFAAAVLAGAMPMIANADDEQGLRENDLAALDRAPEVLQTLTTAPDKGIPRHLLDRAECVVVFPSVTKGAFVLGGEFGRGVATCRDHANGNRMSAPALFTIGGASFGWQFGGEQTDFVLLVMDPNGMSQLLENELKIGGDAAVVAGPVGRHAEASTNITLGAQMLSWSRTRGLFAGVSLEGAVIKPSDEGNRRLYGREISAREILEEGPLSVPAAGSRFVEVAGTLLTGPRDVAGNDHLSAAAALPGTGSKLPLIGFTGGVLLIVAYFIRFRSKQVT